MCDLFLQWSVARGPTWGFARPFAVSGRCSLPIPGGSDAAAAFLLRRVVVGPLSCCGANITVLYKPGPYQQSLLPLCLNFCSLLPFPSPWPLRGDSLTATEVEAVTLALR